MACADSTIKWMVDRCQVIRKGINRFWYTGNLLSNIGCLVSPNSVCFFQFCFLGTSHYSLISPSCSKSPNLVSQQESILFVHTTFWNRLSLSFFVFVFVVLKWNILSVLLRVSAFLVENNSVKCCSHMLRHMLHIV